MIEKIVEIKVSENQKMPTFIVHPSDDNISVSYTHLRAHET